MIDFEISQRLVRMQERLRTATFHEIRDGGGHKRSEGAVSLAFCLPPVVGDREAPHWEVAVYSYVLGPDRNHLFTATSALEAIAKAEDAVATWCARPEMEMFEAAFKPEQPPR